MVRRSYTKLTRFPELDSVEATVALRLLLLHGIRLDSDSEMIGLPATGLFKEVRAFLGKRCRDGVLTIDPLASLVAEIKKHGDPIPQPISLRVIKIRLSDGKAAVVITTLLDKVRYSFAQLKDLYHVRWEEEEFLKLTKELLEAENFRGKCRQQIGRELMAIHLYCFLARILIMECALSRQIPLDRIPQQAAFLAVSRYLDRIWVSQDLDKCQQLIILCLEELAWRR